MNVDYIMWILIIICLLISSFAQVRITNAYNKNSKLIVKVGVVAKDLARRILDTADLNDIQVVQVKGTMTDYYDHKRRLVALSDGVYNSSSVAAIGIMAHEVGHALQYKDGYFPIKLRTFFIKFNNIAAIMMWPVLIIGIILEVILASMSVGYVFIAVILCFYILSTIISLVTLPVETNASRRALDMLDSMGMFQDDELDGIKEMLKAAAFTYLASLITSVVQLVRIIAILVSNKKSR